MIFCRNSFAFFNMKFLTQPKCCHGHIYFICFFIVVGFYLLAQICTTYFLEEVKVAWKGQFLKILNTTLSYYSLYFNQWDLMLNKFDKKKCKFLMKSVVFCGLNQVPACKLSMILYKVREPCMTRALKLGAMNVQK